MNKENLEVKVIDPEASRKPCTLFNCVSEEEGILSIIVQDRLGRPHWQKKLSLNPGSNQVEIPHSRLSSGEYHAWFTFGKTTLIRSFKVTKPGKSFSLGSKIQKLLRS